MMSTRHHTETRYEGDQNLTCETKAFHVFEAAHSALILTDIQLLCSQTKQISLPRGIISPSQTLKNMRK